MILSSQDSKQHMRVISFDTGGETTEPLRPGNNEAGVEILRHDRKPFPILKNLTQSGCTLIEVTRKIGCQMCSY